MRSRLVLVRRVSLGVVDQFVSSGSNFLATLFAARLLPVADFGALAVAMVSFMFTVNITRALCSEALLVRPGDTEPERRDRAARACGSAFFVGLVAAALFVLAAQFTSSTMAGCLYVFAATGPFLLVQDTMRFAAFARADPASALLSDAIWAVGQVACFVAIALFATATGPLILLGWTVPAILGGIVHLARYEVRPTFTAPVSWMAENRDLSVVYAVDFLGSQGAGQLGIYALVLVAGVPAVSGVRGSQTLFGLLNVLFVGTLSVLVPEGRRLVGRSMRALDRMCTLASGVFLAAGLAATVAFSRLPDSMGEALLGSNWEPTEKLIVPAGLALAGSGVLAGLRAGIRALAGAAELLRARMFTAPGTVVFPIAGAVLADAMGASWGIALSVWWNIGWYVRAYRQASERYLAEHDPATTAPPAEEPRVGLAVDDVELDGLG